MISFSGQAILLDVEGTTSSVSFVYEVLFPFARKHVKSFLEKHWLKQRVKQAREQIAKDAGAKSFADWTGKVRKQQALEQTVAEVARLMDGDIKATGLKELQGLIWKEGFESGKLRAHVYDDVVPALKKWHKLGMDIRIYSSGSITAQKLFFAHTKKGDLTPYLNGHYDTTTGPKKEAKSYRLIAKDMQHKPSQILFISDVLAELDAAGKAGMKTALSIRPGNAPVKETHNHPSISSFAEIEAGN